MNLYKYSFLAIIFYFESCSLNDNAEEKRVYHDLSQKIYLYDPERSNLHGFSYNVDSLKLKLNEDKSFSFVSIDPELSNIKGTWKLSQFPELQFWIFKVDGDSMEQWNRYLEVRIKKDTVDQVFAFR